jgi:hypothetical protein
MEANPDLRSSLEEDQVWLRTRTFSGNDMEEISFNIPGAG